MPKHYCPMCGHGTIQTAQGSVVCLSCETSVQSLKSVTLIRPRPIGKG